MFRAAGFTAVVELLLYVSVSVIDMLKAGQGSGVWLLVLPFLWLVLALRLWVGLWVASALAADGGAQFVVAAGAVGLLSTVFLALTLSGDVTQWSGMWVFAPSLLAHVVAAMLVLRSSTPTRAEP